VLILGRLPVRTRTLFFAKLTAVGALPALVIGSLKVFTGLSWPFLFAKHAGVLAAFRSLAAYWIAIILAGAFAALLVIALQGIRMQLLPRQAYSRLSAPLQALAFCALTGLYFLGPSLESRQALTAPENQTLLHWLPAYWFLGLFQRLNGSTFGAFASLAHLAWMGLLVVGGAVSPIVPLSKTREAKIVVDEQASSWISQLPTRWIACRSNRLLGFDRTEAHSLSSMTRPSANPPVAWTWFPTLRPRAEVFIVRKGSTRLAAIAEAVNSNGHSLPIAIREGRFAPADLPTECLRNGSSSRSGILSLGNRLAMWICLFNSYNTSCTYFAVCRDGNITFRHLTGTYATLQPPERTPEPDLV
jgi:hypothetical protein